MSEQNEMPDGPLFVTLKTTKTVCVAPEGQCRHYRTEAMTGIGEVGTCLLRSGLPRPERYIPSTGETSYWCPRRPARVPKDRRTVRPEPSAEQKAALWKELVTSCDAANALEKKTDVELADLLLNHVWGDKNILSTQSALIEEVIERLHKRNKA